ncbi:MAG: hypothetical protein ACJ72Z_00785 [Pyrinomonadaceae bacterium]
MSDTEKNYSIDKVNGDVLLHHGSFGWVRAQEGMTFPECLRVTIKTGPNGVAEVINSEGSRYNVPPRTLRLIDGLFSEADMDTLRFIKVSARDMRAARVQTRLAPVS